MGLSLENIHLRKILKIMYLQGPPRISAFRNDIRDDIARERGAEGEGGGDFYGPFWRDAKDHVFGRSDLRDQTRSRIERNAGRNNLYSLLRDGFLLWWDERRRWTNEPFRPANSIKAVCRVDGINADVKIANILSVRDGRDEDHFVYPYWFPEAPLNDESARLGLWMLCEAFPAIDPSEFRMLDIIRGETYSLDRHPLRGNERMIFQQGHAAALDQWRRLRAEYD
jgi:hypothetical protein